MSIRKRFKSFLRILRKFGRSESGMTLPLIAFSMIMLTSMAGAAIDTARLQLVQSKLQFSLDAAGLAAGSTVNTANINTEVTKYLNANFNGYMGAQLGTVGVTVDASNTLINLTASATLDSTFMAILGIHNMTVHANSQISRQVTGLELVMVLDNTGSMTASAGGGVSKLSALKTAATSLVNSLFGSTTVSTNGKLFVGMVPFSQAVNIGTTHTGWMDANYQVLDRYDLLVGRTTTNWGPAHSWAGCVDARFTNNYDVTDEPPSQTNPATLFHPYFWPSDYLNVGSVAPYGTGTVTNGQSNGWKKPTWKKWNSSRTSYSLVTPTCSPAGRCELTNTAPTYASPLNTSQQGPNYSCPQAVTPMTNDKSIVLNAITNMVAQGNTLIPQGLQWGWHMISPRWQGLWGGTMGANGLPLAYHTHGMNKAIVLLTDGENTIDNNNHSAYWFLGDNKLGTTSSSGAVSALNSRTLQLCTAMKAQGVYIYVIALGTDIPSSSLSMLQSCATASNYFFNSPSTSQLNGIFNAISDSLSNLRVSQ